MLFQVVPAIFLDILLILFRHPPMWVVILIKWVLILTLISINVIYTMKKCAFHANVRCIGLKNGSTSSISMDLGEREHPFTNGHLFVEEFLQTASVCKRTNVHIWRSFVYGHCEQLFLLYERTVVLWHLCREKFDKWKP